MSIALNHVRRSVFCEIILTRGVFLSPFLHFSVFRTLTRPSVIISPDWFWVASQEFSQTVRRFGIAPFLVSKPFVMSRIILSWVPARGHLSLRTHVAPDFQFCFSFTPFLLFFFHTLLILRPTTYIDNHYLFSPSNSLLSSPMFAPGLKDRSFRFQALPRSPFECATCPLFASVVSSPPSLPRG